MIENRMALQFLTLVVFFIVVAFSRVDAQQTRNAIGETSGPDFRSAVEKQTFLLINQYRKAHDLPALGWDIAIAKVARAHSKDMATGEVDFGHDGFRDRVDSLKSVMTGFRGAGENVLMTSNLDQVAQNAVTLWLHSPHHLENIRGDYNYSGLGVWQDKEGTIYFTQIFMKFAPETEETQAAPPPSILVTPFGFLANPETRPAR
jgi:uncharacterized protein YkwD